MENFQGKLGFFPTIFTFVNEINTFLVKIMPFLQIYDGYDNVMHITCLLGIVISLGILIEKESRLINNIFGFLALWFLYFSIFSAGFYFFGFFMIFFTFIHN